MRVVHRLLLLLLLISSEVVRTIASARQEASLIAAPCRSPKWSIPKQRNRDGDEKIHQRPVAMRGRERLRKFLSQLTSLLHKAWLALPSRLPSWWQAHGLAEDTKARVAFLLSNISYLYAGAQILSSGAPAVLGWLVLACCGASHCYHASQCCCGAHSESAARWCTIDTALAVVTGGLFVMHCGVGVLNSGLASISALLFIDAFGLGYTASHGLWHFTTAATALMSANRLQCAPKDQS